MGELIVAFLDKLTSVEFVLALTSFALSLVTALRLLGEVFMALGKLGKQAEKENWLDSAGAFFRSLSTGLGKLLAWFGIGNKK